MPKSFALALLALSLLATPALAQADSARRPRAPPAEPVESRPAPPPPAPATARRRSSAVTHHCLEPGRPKLSLYRHRRHLRLKADDGTVKASIFYIAYALDGVKDPATRPVTFTFNGGPGLGVALGAHGRLRAETRGDDRRGLGPAAARPSWSTTKPRCSTPPTSSSSIPSPPATAARPRVRTRAVPRRQRGRPVGGRLHPPLDDAQRPVGLAEVPGGRKLRHDARRRALRLPPGAARHVPERDRPDVDDPEFRDGGLQRGQRPAVRHLPPDVRHDRLVLQAAGARPSGELSEDPGRGRSLRVDEYGPALLQGDRLPDPGATPSPRRCPA